MGLASVSAGAPWIGSGGLVGTSIEAGGAGFAGGRSVLAPSAGDGRSTLWGRACGEILLRRRRLCGAGGSTGCGGGISSRGGGVTGSTGTGSAMGCRSGSIGGYCGSTGGGTNGGAGTNGVGGQAGG